MVLPGYFDKGRRFLVVLGLIMLCTQVWGAVPLPSAGLAPIQGASIPLVLESTGAGVVQEVQARPASPEKKGLSGFFIIGIAINLAVMAAFAAWAAREWRKSRKK